MNQQENVHEVICLTQLYSIMPGAKKKMVPGRKDSKTKGEVFLYWLNKYMWEYGITQRLDKIYFLATIAIESGELKYTEEIASGAAYEGRKDLGNTQKGDGVKFKGRGLIQLTGRANYEAYSKAVKFDFYSTLAKAKGLAQPGNATRSACWFWDKNNLKALALRDDLKGVRKKVNGGYNGLETFEGYVARAKAAIGY